MIRLWCEVRIALHFLHAMRTADHATLTERVESAAAMALTRALRCRFPDAAFPYTVQLTKAHARDVGYMRAHHAHSAGGESGT